MLQKITITNINLCCVNNNNNNNNNNIYTKQIQQN